MAMKTQFRWLEQMLKSIDSYKVQDGQAIQDFASRYRLELDSEDSPRPIIKKTLTSRVIREIREGRWRRYT